MKQLLSVAVLLGLCLIAPFTISNSIASDAPYEFSTHEEQERFKKLTEELRCLVCQNQSLADSHAELAQDLRNEVYKKVTEGNTNEQIITYLVDRYGDFVLYRPPLKASTYLLWFGPLLFLLIGALIAYLLLRKKSVREITDEERKLASNMLRENIEEGKKS
jgi:cytochrome c-type biogenesis protein CcmH